jgi:NADH-quinone oxidoreductase subunit E
MPLDRAEAEAVIARYPSPRSAILPLLWMGQEADGYVTAETVQQVAELIGLTVNEVESVLSFYTMFRRRPPARCRLQVCRSLACAMHGAEAILEHIRRETGIGPGGQSPDGQFSVDVVECIAACDHAPAYLFNERMGGPLTPDKALALLRGEGEAVRCAGTAGGGATR